MPVDRLIENLVKGLEATWGLDPETSRNHLSSLAKRMLGRPEADVARALERAAIEHRKSVLQPILKDLDSWLRGQLAYKLRDRLDDAVGEALLEVLHYWKPRWATPEGLQHLRGFACVVAKQRAGKRGQVDPARDALALALDPPSAPLDPETLTIEAAAARQRRIVESKLRDLSWLLQALPPAEANALFRWHRPDPTAGLTPKQAVAAQRAKNRAQVRLGQMLEELRRERRRHHRTPAGYQVLVRRNGWSETFRAIDESAGGLGIEGGREGAALELGADYMVRVNSESRVVLRGARCVRVDRTPAGLRFGLQFHFQHPLSPRAQVSL